MEYLVHQLLDEPTVKEIREILLSEEASIWKDGKESAGSLASKVKNNFQLDKNSIKGTELIDIITRKIRSNELIKSFTLPRKLHGFMFTRTSQGQGYGTHIDNSYMTSGRSDLSLTLFLNEPETYEGGELCIQTMQESKEFKLEAGQCLIYPSTNLHSVRTVSKGERLACVGWIQSYVRSIEDRNSLFTLDAGARGMLSKHGRSDELDLVYQAYGNLLRRLGD